MDNNRNSIYDRLDCREISAKNSNGRGCTQKCLLQKASFWTNNFGTASAKEFKSQNFQYNTTPIHILNFFVFF
ncbi:hypothetical protein CNEO4_450001 [Clostridium neonatale]|nr:hypothetical protein CNEO4_450001 [Clostridium neonatale]